MHRQAQKALKPVNTIDNPKAVVHDVLNEHHMIWTGGRLQPCNISELVFRPETVKCLGRRRADWHWQQLLTDRCPPLSSRSLAPSLAAAWAGNTLVSKTDWVSAGRPLGCTTAPCWAPDGGPPVQCVRLLFSQIAPVTNCPVSPL